MQSRKELRVRVKNPPHSLLWGCAGSGSFLLGIPAMLWILFRKFVLRREEKLTWKTQVLEYNGYLNYDIIYEEVFDSPDEAWRRHSELTKEISANQANLREKGYS
ncbi:MAG: hypothetical protein QME41_02550 [Actinomycetota bacterium]|nr:hypothetical protein [Actinomycetota bacterium]